MKILVTFAVEQELAPWRKKRAFRRLESLVPMYDAQVGPANVTIALTGIGLEHAIRSARMVLAQKPDVCITAGLAGGLRPEHGVGRILTPRALRMAEEKFVVKTDARLRRLAAVCGARVVDLFYSSERVVVTAREKAALGMLADAVEMESYAVVTEAARQRVPVVAVRAISDAAGVDLPIDFNQTIGERGEVSLRKVLAQMAARPGALPQVIRMGAETRRAAESLAAFLDSFVIALAERRDEPEMTFSAVVGL